MTTDKTIFEKVETPRSDEAIKILPTPFNTNDLNELCKTKTTDYYPGSKSLCSDLLLKNSLSYSNTEESLPEPIEVEKALWNSTAEVQKKGAEGRNFSENNLGDGIDSYQQHIGSRDICYLEGELEEKYNADKRLEDKVIFALSREELLSTKFIPEKDPHQLSNDPKEAPPALSDAWRNVKHSGKNQELAMLRTFQGSVPAALSETVPLPPSSAHLALPLSTEPATLLRSCEVLPERGVSRAFLTVEEISELLSPSVAAASVADGEKRGDSKAESATALKGLAPPASTKPATLLRSCEALPERGVSRALLTVEEISELLSPSVAAASVADGEKRGDSKAESATALKGLGPPASTEPVKLVPSAAAASVVNDGKRDASEVESTAALKGLVLPVSMEPATPLYSPEALPEQRTLLTNEEISELQGPLVGAASITDNRKRDGSEAESEVIREIASLFCPSSPLSAAMDEGNKGGPEAELTEALDTILETPKIPLFSVPYATTNNDGKDNSKVEFAAAAIQEISELFSLSFS